MVENNDLTIYNTSDLRNLFKCGRRQAYELMNTNGFPSFRLNTKLYVEKKALEKWIDMNSGRQVLMS